MLICRLTERLSQVTLKADKNSEFIVVVKLIRSAGQTVLMLLGLCGLVDNLVEWHGFLLGIVSFYQDARDYAFGFVPIEMADLFKDYLVVGVLSMSGLAMAITQNLPTSDLTSITKVYFIGLLTFIFVVAWPLFAGLAYCVAIWGVFQAIDQFFGVERAPAHASQIWIANVLKDYLPLILRSTFLFLGALFVFSDAKLKLFGG